MKKNKKSKNIDIISRLISCMKFATQLKIAQEERKKKDNNNLDALVKDISEDAYPGREHQGFLTSKNRYVDRKEAWKIADENNQIKFGKECSDNGDYSELVSENLYQND